jgi:threonine-phosphate decarboxylase
MQTPHGGDLYAASKRYSGAILDFSVNLNPLGPPPAVLEAAAQGLSQCAQYPDPQCRFLRRAISLRDGVPEERIFCGNGASELIFRLALTMRPRTALLTAPTFSEYEQALSAVRCKTRFHLLEAQNQFDLTPDILDEITPGLDLLLLCNPNNPTGRIIPKPLLGGILARCRATGTTLILDECFLDLTTDVPGLSEQLATHPNLILLRAFTKSYAIPGLRLGYCLCGDPDLPKQLEKNGPCWNVSLPAQLAGIACCQKPHWPRQGSALAEAERPYLMDALTVLEAQVIPSDTCFLLFRLPGEESLGEKLLQEGILIRSCGNYRGLSTDWYRIAIRSHEDNERLVRSLTRVTGGTLWQK